MQITLKKHHLGEYVFFSNRSCHLQMNQGFSTRCFDAKLTSFQTLLDTFLDIIHKRPNLLVQVRLLEKRQTLNSSIMLLLSCFMALVLLPGLDSPVATTTAMATTAAMDELTKQ